MAKNRSVVFFFFHWWGLKDILNFRQNRSKNKMLREDAVTRVHKSCSLQVMGSWKPIAVAGSSANPKKGETTVITKTSSNLRSFKNLTTILNRNAKDILAGRSRLTIVLLSLV